MQRQTPAAAESDVYNADDDRQRDSHAMLLPHHELLPISCQFWDCKTVIKCTSHDHAAPAGETLSQASERLPLVYNNKKLSCRRDSATLRVIEYFPKSLKVIWNDTDE